MTSKSQPKPNRLTMTDAARLYALILQMPGERPPMPVFVGDAGGGKTLTVKAIAAWLGRHLEVLLTSTRDPSEFLGIPFPSNDGKLRMGDPSWVSRVMDAIDTAKRDVVIFLDEANRGSSATQNALLTPVQDCLVGERQMPRARVRWCAAMNPVTDAHGTNEMIRALTNRALWIPFPKATGAGWAKWVRARRNPTALMDSMNLPRLDLAAFEAALPIAEDLCARFHESVDGALEESEEESEGRDLPAFASPRTWEMLCDVVAALIATGEMQYLLPAAEGLVGPRIGPEFAAFVDQQGLPVPEKYLEGQQDWSPDAGRPDMAFTALMACATRACDVPGHDPAHTLRRRMRVWKLAAKVVAVSKPTALHGIRKLVTTAVPGELSEPGVAKLHAIFAPALKGLGVVSE